MERKGIGSHVQNDFQSGVLAGFYAGGPAAVDLFILKGNLKEAESIIASFLQRDQSFNSADR